MASNPNRLAVQPTHHCVKSSPHATANSPDIPQWSARLMIPGSKPLALLPLILHAACTPQDRLWLTSCSSIAACTPLPSPRATRTASRQVTERSHKASRPACCLRRMPQAPSRGLAIRTMLLYSPRAVRRRVIHGSHAIKQCGLHAVYSSSTHTWLVNPLALVSNNMHNEALKGVALHTT